MRIGIDLDNTICNTSEIIHDRIKKYAVKKSVSSEVITKDPKLIREFYNDYSIDIFKNVSIKDNVSKVLNNLKNKGDKIYVITARSNDYLKKSSVEEETFNWLKKHGIIVDDIITNSYGEAKANVCLGYGIDIMIDDDIINYDAINYVGIKCLLFDDMNNYEEHENRVTSWMEVEEYIERVR